MVNPDGGSASPAIANDTVRRGRKANSHYRPREHLTEREVEKLIGAARGNRNGQRDAAMILMTFRHGLRASELCELQWSDVQFDSAPSTSAEPRAARQPRTRCWVMNCGLCVP